MSLVSSGFVFFFDFPWTTPFANARNPEKVMEFSLKGQQVEALVTSVYDGDTITCRAFPFREDAKSLICSFKVRVDSAEMRHPKGTPETLRELGRRASQS